jgi:hypothetical protein
MATLFPLLEEIHKIVQLRKTELGRLSLVEFDEEEYRTLLSLGREIVQEYQRWPGRKQQKARIIFLALACEYVRRNKYIDDNRFWDGFEAALGIGKQYYALISEELLWRAYEEESIEQKWSSGGLRREFVESLLLEVHASETGRQEVLDFFVWYYQVHSTDEVTIDLLRLYETERGRRLSFPEKALPVLNKDCQTLAQIITYALEQGFLLALTDFDSYNQQIIEALGSQYDLTRLPLIRGKKKLSDLIILLENHCTPFQFLNILKLRPKAAVQMPNGTQFASHKALEMWKTRKFPYGLYLLDGVEYRVVPFRWLALENIAQWPDEEVISLPRGGYIGYKKQTSFNVQVGKRLVDARLCVLQNERCYIWTDAIPYGEPLLIDGSPYQGSVGIDWKVSLRLGYNAQLQPRIEVACDSLKAYFPEKPRSLLSIRSSYDHEQSRFLDLDGRGHFSRDISLPLENFTEPVTIELYLDDELLESKTLSPEQAYLFSCQTHECIPAGTKREWGENRYYLFSIFVNNRASQGIDLELLDVKFSPYRVYQVTWEDHSEPFQLEAGDLSWKFQLPRYLFIQINSEVTENSIQLERHQVHQFNQSVISVISNIDLIDSSVVCQILFSGELICETEIRVCLQPSGDSKYHFASAFLEKLNSLTVEQNRYGRYTFSFTENGKLLEVTTIALIPAVNIRSSQLERLLQENDMLHIEISSPHLAIWDPTNKRASASANIQLHPRMTIDLANKGITYLTPEVLTTFIVFPTIGETVRLKLRPKLFGFRLYRKRGAVTSYMHMQIDALDYYALETAVLYIFTEKHYEITISVEEVLVWSGKADGEGNAIIQGLEFLKKYCRQEQTMVTIASDEQKSTFIIYWKPLIHAIFVEENRVHLDADGPPNSDILLRTVNVDGQVQNLGIVHCRGTQFEAVLDIPSLESDGKQCYLMPVYHLGDHRDIPSARQWRITPNSAVEVSADWLRAGVGISSEELLQFFKGEK